MRVWGVAVAASARVQVRRQGGIYVHVVVAAGKVLTDSTWSCALDNSGRRGRGCRYRRSLGPGILLLILICEVGRAGRWFGTRYMSVIKKCEPNR